MIEVYTKYGSHQCTLMANPLGIVAKVTRLVGNEWSCLRHEW